MGKNRKQEIVEAARILFARYGLEKTTTEDISSALKMQKGALYHYFQSKEAIFAEVIQGEMERLKEKVEVSVQNAKGVVEQFSAYMKTRMCYLKEKVDEFTTVRDEYLKHYSFMEDLRKEYSVWEEGLIKTMLTGGVRAGELNIKEIDLVANTIFLAIKGLEYTWITRFSVRQINLNVDRLLGILFHGLFHAQ